MKDEFGFYGNDFCGFTGVFPAFARVLRLYHLNSGEK